MGAYGRWDDYDIAFMVVVIVKQGSFKHQMHEQKKKLYDVPTCYTKFLNMTFFDIELKTIVTSN
jgi:hypothetical protein